MATFKLSANAKEFVPGKLWSASAKTPVSYQPQAYGDGPPVDIPTWSTGVKAPSWSPGTEQGAQPVPEHVQFVQDTIYHMSISPGNYDEYMKSLVEALNSSLTEPRQLEDVADLVFDQSVLEPNFTYTGAKMCEYLHKNLVLKENFIDFRKLINKRAKDICVSRNLMVKHPEDVLRLRGATVFLTELFLNSEVVADGQVKKIAVYRIAQKEMMETLSSHPNTENYKCLGQIFKLAGKLIEDYDREIEKTKFSEAVSEVFINAKNVIIDGSIDKDVRQMWLQLIERRASDWGRAKRSPLVAGSGLNAAAVQSGASAATPADVPFTNEPVFYGPDGRVISAAEAGFSNVDDFEKEFETYGPGDGAAYDQYEDDDVDDFKQLEEAIAAATLGPGGDYSVPDYDDWDPEVEAAFEQFQQESAHGYHSDYR